MRALTILRARKHLPAGRYTPDGDLRCEACGCERAATDDVGAFALCEEHATRARYEEARELASMDEEPHHES